MRKNRDRLSIVAAILETAHSGVNKTRIMFLANLSFNLLEKYLDVVLRAGFIQVEEGKYELTEQGQDFLKRYKEFHERYVKAQELLKMLSCERDKLTMMCKKEASQHTNLYENHLQLKRSIYFHIGNIA